MRGRDGEAANDHGNDVVQVLWCSETQRRSIMLTLTYPKHGIYIYILLHSQNIGTAVD